MGFNGLAGKGPVMPKFRIRDLLGMGQNIPLAAPLAGWLMAPADGPGAGLVIDPVDHMLQAPCDGVVTRVLPGSHNLTMILANGARLLLSIGTASHGWAGTGLVPHVAAGQWVWAGDPLISFDMDSFAHKTRSLLISMAVLGGTFRMSPAVINRPIASGEPLASIRPLAPSAT